GFASAATRLGVAIHGGVPVTGVTISDGACVGVETSAGSIRAGAVVSAVAGWTSIVASMSGLRLPISTHPLQAFVTEPYRHVLDGLVSSMDLYVYISQTARGELLVGAEILPYNTYSTRSTFDFLSEAAKRSIQILPFMARARAMRQWAGLCDMTPDSSPILGETEVPRFFLMAGMGTWGFKGSPIFGRTMAELVATGRPPDQSVPAEDRKDEVSELALRLRHVDPQAEPEIEEPLRALAIRDQVVEGRQERRAATEGPVQQIAVGDPSTRKTLDLDRHDQSVVQVPTDRALPHRSGPVEEGADPVQPLQTASSQLSVDELRGDLGRGAGRHARERAGRQIPDALLTVAAHDHHSALQPQDVEQHGHVLAFV